MPQNGGSYNALLNTTTKPIAAVAACLSTLMWASCLTLQLVRMGHERPGDLGTLGGGDVTAVALWTAHALKSAGAVWEAWLGALEGLHIPRDPA